MLYYGIYGAPCAMQPEILYRTAQLKSISCRGGTILPDPLGRSIVIQLVLLVFAAFFALAGQGVRSASANKLKKLTETEGGGFARRLLKTVQSPEGFLEAMQACQTLVILCAAVHGAIDVTPYVAGSLALYMRSPAVLSAAAVILAQFVLLTVFGTLLPRRYAALRPYKALRVVFMPAWFIWRLTSPVTWLLDKMSLGIARLLRIRPGTEVDEVSEDEIRMMVDIGEEAGAIEAAEKEMIENVFEFNNMTAEDIMVHRTDMVIMWVDDTEDEILASIRENGLSRFPVCREDVDDVVGILSARDFLLNRGEPIEKLLRSAYFVPESVRTDVLFRDMQRQKVHMAIVVDEYGGTSGLLTMEDLLEQLVGEIYDEFDEEEELEIIKLGDNLWRISGGAELEVVAESLKVDLPEDEEYGTLGGLIFSQISVIPDDGSHPAVDICGLHIEVEQLLDRRVEWARVSKILPQESIS